MRGEDALLALGRRLGREHLARRLRAQVGIMTRAFGGLGRWHWEQFELALRAGGGLFRLAGLAGAGRRDALALQVVERTVPVPGLPGAFAGLRVLHLSDLHVEGLPELVGTVRAAVRRLRFDLCVLTGDFRFRVAGGVDETVALAGELLPALACPLGVYAVLGNHDFLELVPPLEAAGMRFLLNEAVALRRGGSTLWLVGVDDPHFYGTHDLRRAYAAVPAGSATVLLAHSPELARVAAESHRPNVYLCGHTHGGQICLPGGRCVVRNCRAPRALTAGGWRLGGTVGYTSRGVGVSGIPLRFHCPPEITVHHLQPAPLPPALGWSRRRDAEELLAALPG